MLKQDAMRDKACSSNLLDPDDDDAGVVHARTWVLRHFAVAEGPSSQIFCAAVHGGDGALSRSLRSRRALAKSAKTIRLLTSRVLVIGRAGRYYLRLRETVAVGRLSCGEAQLRSWRQAVSARLFQQ